MVELGCFFAGIDFHPGDGLLATVSFLNRGVNDIDHDRSNIHPNAIALNVGNDWMVGHRQAIVCINRDDVAGFRYLDVLICHV